MSGCGFLPYGATVCSVKKENLNSIKTWRISFSPLAEFFGSSAPRIPAELPDWGFGASGCGHWVLLPLAGLHSVPADPRCSVQQCQAPFREAWASGRAGLEEAHRWSLPRSQWDLDLPGFGLLGFCCFESCYCSKRTLSLPFLSRNQHLSQSTPL